MIRRSDELAAVMRRLMRAYEAQDQATVRGLFSQSDETLVVGTAPDEWLYGLEAHEVVAAQIGEMPAGYRWVVHRLSAHEEGTVGWAAVDSTVEWSDGRHTPIRLTAVFRLEDGVWRVVQWHASVPVSEEAASGVELTTSLSQLLGALDDDVRLTLQARFKTATVTLLFSDIEKSTQRAAELGDVVWGDVVKRHFAEVHRIAGAHGGVVVKTMGDGAMLAFDSARDAARSAVAIQRSRTPDDAVTAFRLRVGVHTGDAMHTDGDYIGQTVNKTARIAATADAGQILVSDVVRGLVEGTPGIAFGERSSVVLKGLPGVHDVYPLREA